MSVCLYVCMSVCLFINLPQKNNLGIIVLCMANITIIIRWIESRTEPISLFIYVLAEWQCFGHLGAHVSQTFYNTYFHKPYIMVHSFPGPDDSISCLLRSWMINIAQNLYISLTSKYISLISNATYRAVFQNKKHFFL